MSEHFNPAKSKCSHGKVFNERCIECEKVSLMALIRHAEQNIKRWNGALAELDVATALAPSPAGREG